MNKLIIGFAAALMLGAAACGGSDGPTAPSSPGSPASPAPGPSPSPTPTPAPTPGQTPFTQTITGNAERFENVFHELIVPRAGMLTVKLRWVDGRDDLDLALTANTCRIDETGCPIIVESANNAGTLEQIALAVTEGQSFRIWVGNYEPHPMSYTVEIDIR